MIESRVELIGPVRAKELLDGMLPNRRIRPLKVSEFAADMAAGRWRETGEAIKLDEHGRMIDGGHRCSAIIMSGATIPTLVVYGVSEDSRVAMDTGTSRSLADILEFRGERQTRTLAAAVAALAARRGGSARNAGSGGRISGNRSLSRQALLDVLEQHPGIRESVTTLYTAVKHLRMPYGIAAALHYDMCELDRDDAEHFWTSLADGSGLERGNPIFTLREKLLENAGKRTGKLQVEVVHAFIIKAWNAYREGRELTQLKWTRGGAHPEAFPELV